ncbi:late protein L1 [Tadarida brasiliensis papillomavirus 1]|uniref:Major capsid protein L1 n=1 Tax=Tadarida brasiliensis papillomavirus 1 TaxID=2664215 RepID=A0A5Q2EYK6_9PAPI|nr:late protein L1 [Tadarida brasiliensis papillomavirus 1]
MAVWLPAQNKFYLPPQPVTRILNTEDYVTRTDIFLQCSSERLLTVGHPYYQITKEEDGQTKVLVPKVSPNQYRVFRVFLPDPNNFAFGCNNIFDPQTERLVWCMRGIEVNRGLPLGIPASGHPLLNRNNDAENPFAYLNNIFESVDTRMNVAFDPKQVQMLIVGCTPATGEYWDVADTSDCTTQPAPETGTCPAIQLKTSVIEDGDMCDIGLGAMNFKTLQPNRSDAPLDINTSITKYPDYIKMTEEPYGDSMFFYARREALYARHIFIRGGTFKGEEIPKDEYLESGQDQEERSAKNLSDNYMVTPSGSLVTTESQLLNRPYWVQRSQGKNNGVAWRNQLFVTVVDNSRGASLMINAKADGQEVTNETKFLNSTFNEYTRHCEEFQLSFIVQLCKVKLTPENLAYIHTMNPKIIEDWHLAVNAPPNEIIANHYRYIKSLATPCPPSEKEKDEEKDPYADYKFWEVDMRERLTEQLDETSIGRKFLYQSGLSTRNLKRVITQTPKYKPAKKKRKS